VRDALGAVRAVLVLGGGSDIARATVEKLIDAGAESVVLAARRPEALVAAAEAFRVRGAAVEVVEFDADDVSRHTAFVGGQFDRLGDVDLVLVAFGVLGDEGVSADHDAALRLLRTNFLGGASALLAVAARMRRQGHGAIVVLSSVAGERVRKSNFVYGASKAGLDGLAQGLGDSLAGSGVDVIVVRPGFVHTKMTAGMSAPPFSTQPEAVATAIVEALRRRTPIVWVPPALRVVMAVARHLPRGVFRRLKF
jgi:decaprenylphospho-beta-D-erythro-pentofuranosid-2-ulose 2-reductase